MNPIFKEYCGFLKDKINLELEEGYYWIDNSIIKAFDKEGNIHKLYRIVIDNEDLSMSYKVPKGYSKRENIDIASWNDVIGMNMKLHGRNVNKFYCKKCLMKLYDMDKDKWNSQVEMFKQQGCDLF